MTSLLSGMQLLQKMGWRQGRGVAHDPASQLLEGAQGSKWGAVAGVGPDNTPLYLLHPKKDLHGLGYDPFKVWALCYVAGVVLDVQYFVGLVFLPSMCWVGTLSLASIKQHKVCLCWQALPLLWNTPTAQLAMLHRPHRGLPSFERQGSEHARGTAASSRAPGENKGVSRLERARWTRTTPWA